MPERLKTQAAATDAPQPGRAVPERLKPWLAALAVAALCAVSFAGVLSRPGLVGHTWDWGVPSFAEQYRSMADHHFSTWDAYFETGRYHYFKLELVYWQLITPLAGIGGEWMSKLLPLAFVLGAGLAMLPLARRLGLNWFNATLSGVLYGLSPYAFSRVVAGHMPMLAGYALIPLLLLAFFRLADAARAGRIRAVPVLSCGLLLGLTSLHPSVGVGAAVMLGLLGLYFLARGPGRGRLAASTGMVFALALCMNIHFMAPFLADYLGKGAIRHGWGLSASAKGDVTVDTELPMRESFHQSTSQPVDAALRLDLRPGMDTEYAYHQPRGLRLPWVAASAVLAGLALCSFLARRGREEAGGLLLVAAVGVLLAGGSRTPLGIAFYQGLLKGAVPILFAAFSNTTRWLPLIVTAYALLAFQLPQRWEESGARRPWLIRAAMAALVLVFVSPFWGQQLLDDSPKDKVPQPLRLKHTPVHPEDAHVYAFLRDQRAGFRVAYLPPVGISWPGDSPYGYEWSSAYSPKPFFLAFYNNPLGAEIIASLYAEQPGARLDRLFGLASVKYLVYPKYDFFISYQDFQPLWRGEPQVDGFKNYKPVLDRALALQEGLRKLDGFETVDVYYNPQAAPEVLASDRLLAVADASGQGADLTAQVLPDVAGLDFYRPGQALVAAGDDPRFLDLLGRAMGGVSRRAFVSDRAGKRQALVFAGEPLAPPSAEFRRLGPTRCLVRLHGVKGGFPLLFQETFHDGWSLSLLPVSAPDPEARGLLGRYRALAGNELDQATPAELAGYLDTGRVSTLGDGLEKRREIVHYGQGGRVAGRDSQAFRVDFVSRESFGAVQNDNLPDPGLAAGWREGGFAPLRSGAEFDPLSSGQWKASGQQEGLALSWPALFHWKAGGFGNVWWLDPALLESLGPDRARYARPNPTGGVDLEVLVEFRPQRYYLLGLCVSALTAGLSLAALALLGLRAAFARRRGHA
ncbi:hypothetical protein NNJEOMEG_02507 [Fundidesulfovibrio magnetotacticus]|uniref:Membrane protein 6-pyruvoyl-tetrahydropterin synthase-related domain-containing protein n=1 Tax=Fundidesulfovibrio magnetotacticus TaxID=2730080 RepID=A0A6V8LUM8_9BACT|nr:hypothetical protein [Fundidesulfovibrio magnetotacticus]GFK94660.1 hypothetical protein NNJEOMEG_02507 [Fundidesulfovibrio magnetotacticus]